MSNFASDLRYVRRSFARRPGPAAATLLVASLGISLSTAMFALTDPFLFRPLPFVQPRDLVVIRLNPDSYSGRMDAQQDPLTPTLDQWKARSALFLGVTAISHTAAIIDDGDHAVDLFIPTVTSDFWSVLGIKGPPPSAWRSIGGQETPVILTPSGRRALAGTSRTGQLLRSQDGRRFRVVGELPETFLFPDPELRTGDAIAPLEAGRIAPQEGCCALTVVARLRPRVTLAVVSDALSQPLSSGRRLDLRVEALSDRMRGQMGPLAAAALASGLLVLFICAGNLANLHLARSIYRLQEFETRRSLGASRFDLIRPLVVELIATLAAAIALGLGVAAVALRLAASVVPAEYVVLGPATLNMRSVAFATFAGLVVGAGALLPVLAVAREGTARRTAVSNRHMRGFRIGFASVQAALAMILAVSAAMLVQSFSKLYWQDTGYDGRSVYLDIRYPATYDNARLTGDIYQSLEVISAMPGLNVVGAIQGSVVGDGQSKRSFTIDGTLVMDDSYLVTPGFFEAAGMTVVHGRLLSPNDRPFSGVVVNEAFARTHWPGAAALGRKVGIAGGKYVAEVVGVVHDALAHGLAAPATPTAYFVMSAVSVLPTDVEYVIRPDGGALSSMEPIRRALLSVAPQAVLGPATTIDEELAQSVRGRIFATVILGLFAVAACIVCVSGLVAIVTFVVARRTRETAIRITLGAQASDILRLVTTEAATAATVGGAVGLLLGRTLSLGLRALVFGIEAGNWTTTCLAGAVALGLMIAAAFVAARRAVSLQPTEALRVE